MRSRRTAVLAKAGLRVTHALLMKPWHKPWRAQALEALVERTEGDVRACLGTLQLLARAADVRAATAGHRDRGASAFGIWQSLFSNRVRSASC